MSLSLPNDIALRRKTFDAAATAAWRAMLPDEERARYERFPVQKRRREFLLGRAALRTLLADRLRTDPQHVPLRIAEHGALEVPGTAYHVSLTHAENRAVAALAERPVGIDLERVAARDASVTEFLLHPSERALLDTLPLSEDAAFTLCWTLKEAVLKALGTGLRRSPKKLRLEIDAEEQTATVRAWNGSAWQAAFEERNGFFLSVAWPAPQEHHQNRG